MCFCSIVFAFIVCGLCISHVNQVKVSALFVSKAIRILFRNNYTTSVGGKNRGSIIERTSQCCQPAERAIIVCHRECVHTNTHTRTYFLCWPQMMLNKLDERQLIYWWCTHTHKHTGQMDSWVGIVFQTSNFWLIYLCVCVCLCRVDSVHYLHGSSPTRTSVDSWL